MKQLFPYNERGAGSKPEGEKALAVFRKAEMSRKSETDGLFPAVWQRWCLQASDSYIVLWKNILVPPDFFLSSLEWSFF